MIKVIKPAFHIPETPPVGTEGRCGECGAKFEVISQEVNGFKKKTRFCNKGRKYEQKIMGWINVCPECGCEEAFFAYAFSINGCPFQKI